MRKIILFFCISICIQVHAQQSDNSETLFSEGLNYLRGVSKSHDPLKARQLLVMSAKLGNTKAMMLLGDIFSSGIGFQSNKDSSIYWFKVAAKANNDTAFYKLGKLYYLGKGGGQNFVEAVKYYKQGVLLGNKQCKNALAYMSYKGFGTEQSYDVAFKLFKETAEAGFTNSMYFLGLCYKNGYGTSADNEKANYWLKNAAKDYDIQAINELNEEIPENVSVVSSHLQQQMKYISDYKEKYIASNNNNYEGMYRGYAIYYDWSGKYISEILPLNVELKADKKGYIGTWKEANNDTTKIKALAWNNQFVLHNTTPYIRNNHYSGREDEAWRFKQAKLNLSFVKDSQQLSGFIQFYSSKRKEPGKPFFVILKKPIDSVYNHLISKISFSIFPNPARENIKVEFEVSKTTRIGLKIVGQNGSLYYTENPKVLPVGKYVYNLPISILAAGFYEVQLVSNEIISSTKPFIKQ